MTAPLPVPSSRPRIVDAAFWLWLISSILLVSFGMLLAFSQNNPPPLVRGAGALFAVSGLALGYLAGRARMGDAGFRRAAVGLALALVLLLAVFSLMSRGLIWALLMIVTILGPVLVIRPSAQDLVEPEEQP